MVTSNSDAFPLSGPILRTVRPAQFASSGAEKRPERSFLHNPKTAGRLLFLMVFLLSALYGAKDLKRGWIPSDEGTFGQSAERVLQGELPHKDFDEGYTGGLTHLHALAFRVAGNQSGQPPIRSVFVFPGLGSGHLFCGFAFRLLARCQCGYISGGGVEYSKLFGSHAVMVQPFFRYLRASLDLALH